MTVSVNTDIEVNEAKLQPVATLIKKLPFTIPKLNVAGLGFTDLVQDEKDKIQPLKE